MKSVQNFLKSFSFLLLMVIVSNKIIAQDDSKDQQASAMQKKLDDKSFVFTAQSVTPQRGTIRQLTSTYDLRVSNDSVICNLPYFGRAYSAPIDPSAGGINFTSTSFDYTVKPRKKSGWDVVIKPNGESAAQQLLLNVFANGSASLQVISNNRQPIFFNGNVK